MKKSIKKIRSSKSFLPIIGILLAVALLGATYWLGTTKNKREVYRSQVPSGQTCMDLIGGLTDVVDVLSSSYEQLSTDGSLGSSLVVYQNLLIVEAQANEIAPLAEPCGSDLGTMNKIHSGSGRYED